MTDPAVIRERFLDAVFNAAANIGAACGISGRALYESLVPIADDAVAACLAAAGELEAQSDTAEATQ
ncbi:hypothetical protein ACFYTF_29265 [Nocardia thailandica]|uniref:Uncharacterized protein n=1 Tax=Nocardia thailandica TaxID=257275 RepID=A0ABW6PWW8_9NOCA